MKRLILTALVGLSITATALSQESFTLFAGPTSFSIQDPPSGWNMFTGVETPGAYNHAIGFAAGVAYQKDILLIYAKTSLSAVTEKARGVREGGRYTYVYTTAGVGAKKGVFGIAVGLASLTDSGGHAGSRNRLGVNITGFVDIPISENASLLIVPETSFTAYARQVVAVTVGASYRIP